MGKRKRVTKSLEETDRKLFKTFSSAANAVSLLYTQAQSQQKRAYLAGMQDAYEKVIKFMQSQQNIEVAACLARLSDYVRQELDAVDESIDADDVVMETKV
ncbi:hypothetical protein HOP50_16g77390 [Chloropicon primus]|uniref:Uncharacterized protein n=2 Tax=Chloropicon primus TaxID=1764295 RepID=A0A5B8MXA3_9CHLO|nr:hypothetical protein A3770_16p77110 [Chloropicon primus]UPR04398.1 hypothetical protein HOP50_16g77390 [Chloropicon primus]|eukprot:QDZ25193.1 hypothetical protein A3770_16p77110 [Chloropicon primus]